MPFAFLATPGAAKVYVEWFTKHKNFVRMLDEFETISPGPTAESIVPIDDKRVLEESFWHSALDTWFSTTEQWRQQMTSNGYTAPAIPAMLRDKNQNVKTRWEAAVNYTNQAQAAWYQAAQQASYTLDTTEIPATEGSDEIYSEDLWLSTSRNGDAMLNNWQQRRQGQP